MLAALGACAKPEVEDVLLQFAALIPGLAQQHEWLAALRTLGTKSSGRALLQLLRDGTFDPGYRDIETLGVFLAQLAKSHPDFRAEMLGLLDHLDKGILISAIERALLMLSDTESSCHSSATTLGQDGRATVCT